MSHTPGPWHEGGIFNPDSAHPTVNIWTEAATGNQSGDVIAFDVSLRNAKLIAAAPDLLKLAHRVIEYFGDDEIDDMLNCDIEVRDMARAAIAKAEGRS